MADIVVTTTCSSPRFSNNSSINEVHNCKKCAEVEIQLQQVFKDRSTQLIIQMLKKESMPEDATTTSNQLAKSDLCTADEWEVKITKGNKGWLEGNMESRNNEVLISKNHAAEMINRYAVLTNDDGMH